jgi:hypothetical protein
MPATCRVFLEGRFILLPHYPSAERQESGFAMQNGVAIVPIVQDCLRLKVAGTMLANDSRTVLCH